MSGHFDKLGERKCSSQNGPEFYRIFDLLHLQVGDLFQILLQFLVEKIRALRKTSLKSCMPRVAGAGALRKCDAIWWQLGPKKKKTATK